jgi:hypothetical protein
MTIMALPPDSGRNIVKQLEGKSLYAFGDALRGAPNLLNDMARIFDDWANLAHEEHVMSEVVVEHIRSAAKLIRAIGVDSAEWHSAYRKNHEMDVARVETPRRGSRAAEKRADVTASEQDGF